MDEPLTLPLGLDRQAARELLADVDCDALSALLALSVFLGDDLFDEEGQPYLEDELLLMLEDQQLELAPENLTRACGLLFAVTGDEMLETVLNFRRFVNAVNHGRLFDYEDDDDQPELPDVFWAMYLAELLTDDPLIDELSTQIGQYLRQLAEDEVEDLPGLRQAMAEEGDDLEQIEDYVTARLTFRRATLALRLKRLGVKPEWMADTDQTLALLLA